MDTPVTTPPLSRREFLKKTSAAVAGSMAAGGCAGQTPAIAPAHPGEPPPHRTLFTNGQLLSLPEGRITPGWSLLVEAGHIAWAGPDTPCSGLDARHIDLQGGYLLPGLMDAHCHMTLPSAASFSPLLGLATWRQLRRNFENQLASGVTRVRDMGAMPPVLSTLVRQVDKGELAGPDVITCNAIFNVDGGHPDISPSDVSWVAAFGSLFTGAPTVSFKEGELASAFEANCRSADFVKITLDNTSLIAGKPFINRYSDPELATIFRLARDAGKPVAGHAMSRYGVDRALAYPIHSLEHTVSDGPLDEATLKAMADNKVSVVPTTILANLYTLLDLAEPLPKGLLSRRALLEAPIREAYLTAVTEDDVEPAIHENNLAMLDAMQKHPFSELYTRGDYTFNPHLFFPILTHGQKNLMRMKEAGIRIGCGTDAGVPLNYHGAIVRELQCMARLGFTNTEALTCATVNNAHILGVENEAGTLAPGKRADFITMAKNPLQDLAALNNLTLIVKNGTVYETT